MLGFRIGRVRGCSMLPRIMPDSFILSFHFPSFYPKKIGQIFYLQHPTYGAIVKTLSQIDEQGNYWFRGESPDSVSEQKIGALSEHHIIGRVIKIINP